MKIYAHRGYSAKYPENTLIAFAKALEYNADGIECDIQLTKDSVPVIIHDEKIDRTSNGTGFVKDYTYQELLSFDFAHYKPGDYGKLPIMTLRELLVLISDAQKSITLNIELKNDHFAYNGMEEIILNEVKVFEDDIEIIYSSFNHSSLKLIKELQPTAQTAALVENERDDLITYLKTLKVDGIHPSILILDEEIIQELIANHIYVNVYTINDAALAQRLADNKVAGVFTDYCKEMKETLLYGKEFSID